MPRVTVIGTGYLGLTHAVGLAWNPEFLREGFAVQDSLAPDRIVLGVTSDGAAEMLREVYRGPLEAGPRC